MKHDLLAYALSTPWALMPERMAAYAAVIASHIAGKLPTAGHGAAPNELAAAMNADILALRAMAAAGQGGSQGAAGSGGIAVIGVFGAIVEWGYQIDICDGGTSARNLARQMTEAEADPAVGQILLVFNTPGGSVYGIQECADIITRVKATKPVIGVAQSLAASGGYWLLAQCTEAYCTPGGEVGSIGVYSGYENVSKALEIAGVDVELIASGKYKVELSPFSEEGLSDEARAYQQQRTADYYTAFAKAVSKGRKVGIDAVRNGMGEGRVLGADGALAENMIDGIAPMEEVLRKMQKASKSTGSRSARQAQDLTDIVQAAGDAPAPTAVAPAAAPAAAAASAPAAPDAPVGEPPQVAAPALDVTSLQSAAKEVLPAAAKSDHAAAAAAREREIEILSLA